VSSELRSAYFYLITVIPGLAERRGRKRALRSITHPPMEPEQDDACNISDEDGDGKVASQKRKKRKKVVAPAMALMHGFVATNVGQSRLTVRTSASALAVTADRLQLRPADKPGVFQKGRASAKAVASGRGGTKSTEFHYLADA
jgi:hypothetical protein